jgi:hypothetical protein
MHNAEMSYITKLFEMQVILKELTAYDLTTLHLKKRTGDKLAELGYTKADRKWVWTD